MKHLNYRSRIYGAGLVLAASAAVCLLALSNPPGRATPRPAGRSETARAARARAAQNYAKLPLSFVPGVGQPGRGPARYLSRGKGYTVTVAGDGVVVSFRNADSQNGIVEMKLLAANPAALISASDELPGKMNYLTGADPHQWRTNVPTYAKVTSRSVYPGVDLVYYGNQRQLEYDFVVAPGADPDAIRLGFSSPSDTMDVAANGDLVARVDGGEVRVHKPVAYQLGAGGRKEYIAASFVSRPSDVTFALGAYDRHRALVIDPVLAYSTYLGGSDDENDETYGAITVDLLGNAYVTGDTDSHNFPIKLALQPAHAASDDSDIFVTKLSADGSSLVYSTYLGGSGSDQAYAIGVDLGGHAYVAGSTLSVDFPVTTGAAHPAYKGTGTLGYGDGFVAKLNANGSALVYSTYLGGASDDGVNSLAVDLAGSVYVTGSTSSVDFPVTAGALQTVFGGNGDVVVGDVFVTKLNANGKVIYSTFLGAAGDESALGIAVDVFGDAYLAGTTSSLTFPVTAGAAQTSLKGSWDGFIVKLNSAGSKLEYGTYYGGTDFDECAAIALDGFGNAYVTGDTVSIDLPVSASAYHKSFSGSGPRAVGDGFVAKLSASGKSLIYSTYLGGSGDERLAGITVDLFGNAYVTGWTNSANFPVTPGAFQTTYGGTGPNQNGDAFLTVLNPQGAGLRYSTYFGGKGDEAAAGLAMDWMGNIYITGSTNSADLPVTQGAFQKTFAGSGAAPENSGDGFVTKFGKNLF